MGSSERPKKKVHLWKKATVHFLLCFIVGFFTGFAPANKSSFATHNVVATNASPEISPQPEKVFVKRVEHENGNFDRSVLDESLAMKVQERPNLGPKEEKGDMGKEVNLTPRRLVIIVTPTSDKDELRGVLLRKMANTLSLVPPPLLWVVVESQSESTEVSDILRKTNVMYRHLVFKENFTDIEVEMDYQRNVALKHIEYHRLSGIVHFASLYNVYDLSFFDEIRAIEYVFPSLTCRYKVFNKYMQISISFNSLFAYVTHKANSCQNTLPTELFHLKNRLFIKRKYLCINIQCIYLMIFRKKKVLTMYPDLFGVFGTWPMAFLSANRQRVRIEGPVCDSSEVIGWHLKSLNNSADDTTRSPVHISTVGFNSSILWDPERWGRLTSAQHTSQNSIKFVKEEVLEEETKLKGIPQDGCSKIMLWNLHIPRVIKA
ncbi:putative 1,4-beta-D-xylan synthase [Helianthus annuus]|nr:putative 1,4-beta-D-xylan synthase [Helianthus annuus]